MQSVSSRIWTRVAVSISYDDNHYTTGTSLPTPPLSQDMTQGQFYRVPFIAIAPKSSLIRSYNW